VTSPRAKAAQRDEAARRRRTGRSGGRSPDPGRRIATGPHDTAPGRLDGSAPDRVDWAEPGRVDGAEPGRVDGAEPGRVDSAEPGCGAASALVDGAAPGRADGAAPGRVRGAVAGRPAPTAPRGPIAVLRAYRPFMPVFLGLFLSLLTVGASLAVLPFYVVRRLGGGPVEVGVVVAAIAVTSILARPTAGRLGDRRGYKPVMLAGALLCAAAGAGYLVVDLVPALPGPPVAALLAVRLLHGVGEATVCTGGVAWLVSLSPPERRGRIVGLYGVYMWLGITLGASAGGLLVVRGYPPVWLFCVATPLVGAVLVALKRPPVQGPPPAGRAGLFPRVVWLPGIAMTLGGLGYAALAGFGALYLDERGIAGGGLVFGAFGTTYIGVRLLLGNLPDRRGGAPVAFWSGLVEVAGLLLVAYGRDLPTTLAGAAVAGAGLSLLFPALALLVIRRTPAERQGGAVGAFTSFWDLGIAVGPPLTGALRDRGSYPLAFAVMAVAAALTSLLAVVRGRSDRRAARAAGGVAPDPARAAADPGRSGPPRGAGVPAQRGKAGAPTRPSGAGSRGPGAASRGSAAGGGRSTADGRRRKSPAATGGAAGEGRAKPKAPGDPRGRADAPGAVAGGGGRGRSRKQRKRAARRRSRG
jgi:MFS family permease